MDGRTDCRRDGRTSHSSGIAETEKYPQNVRITGLFSTDPDGNGCNKRDEIIGFFLRRDLKDRCPKGHGEKYPFVYIHPSAINFLSFSQEVLGRKWKALGRGLVARQGGNIGQG